MPIQLHTSPQVPCRTTPLFSAFFVQLDEWLAQRIPFELTQMHRSAAISSAVGQHIPRVIRDERAGLKLQDGLMAWTEPPGACSRENVWISYRCRKMRGMVN
jgi:hypothetical protein